MTWLPNQSPHHAAWHSWVHTRERSSEVDTHPGISESFEYGRENVYLVCRHVLSECLVLISCRWLVSCHGFLLSVFTLLSSFQHQVDDKVLKNYSKVGERSSLPLRRQSKRLPNAFRRKQPTVWDSNRRFDKYNNRVVSLPVPEFDWSPIIVEIS